MTQGYQKDIERVASLSLPWEKLSGSNILVTGATGLIGACLVDVLMNRQNRDYDVYVAGRNEARAKKLFAASWDNPQFHFFQYDVMRPLQTGVSFHYIIHAASK